MGTKRKDQYRPPDDAVWFLPLGGAGEIGMNLGLYGTAGKWLMVDCGVTFGDETTPGIEVIMPDISFIRERSFDLVGLVVTHGHEDHLGAIEYLWPELQCPVFATPFTAGLISAKIAERDLQGQVRLRELPLRGKIELGPFNVELISVTHSIPESNMLAIRTAQGTILHTGDWKLDPEPVIGELTDKDRLIEIGREGVMALVGDSTNAVVPGRSGSEMSVQKCFAELFGRIQKRIIVTCFASNIARIKSIAIAAKKNKREVGLVGRSLWRNAEIAEETGYLDEFPNFLSEHDAGYMPREKIVMICTGSQGEVRSALARLATGDHPELGLEKGDTVIFSSREIPGNEKAIAKVQNALVDMGVELITVHDDPGVHVSGHPARDELTELYQWIRPKLSVPVHGEPRHQAAHAELARQCQVKKVVIPANGQIVRLGPGVTEIVGEVPHGQIGLDGKVLRPLNNNAMKDRRRIGFNGAAVVTIVLDRGGRMIDRPKIALLGLVGGDADLPMIEEATCAVEDAIDTMPKSTRIDDQAVRHKVQQILRRTLNDLHGKKPLTEVHVVRV